MKKALSLLLIFCSNLLFANDEPPKLVVQIVIDQLRGDLINLYHEEFGANGFNYLLSHGLDFHNTHHPHANTVTCVGHATIATGSYPALHGIVHNHWYDRKTSLSPYCVSDPQSPILPTSRSKKQLTGRSPKYLAASTLSDELVLAQAGRAFAVSLKDRAAITLAGHAGKAFWFDKLNGGFVTSRHYYSTYPQWVKDWNNHYQPKDLTWSLNRPAKDYHFTNAPRFTNRFPGFGKTFPHSLGLPNSKQYYKYLSMSPFADELTADFAIDLLAQERLGKNKNKTDYLAISFSAVDGIGHQFGPNSLESEDNLLHLDRTLAKLLEAIDQQIGLANSLIILTADHGITDSPSYLANHQMAKPPSLEFSKIRTIIQDRLATRFNLPAQTLEAFIPPYIYLNHQLIAEHRLPLSLVKGDLAEILEKQSSIYKVYRMPATKASLDWIGSKVSKMAYPGRSGDLYLVPLAHEAIDSNTRQRVSHGTPWSYDSYVPLLFVNPKFKAMRIFRPVNTTDIAATLAALLMIKPPSATVGQPLEEVLNLYQIKSENL